MNDPVLWFNLGFVNALFISFLLIDKWIKDDNLSKPTLSSIFKRSL